MKGSRVILPDGQAGVVQSTRWVGDEYVASVLLEGNSEIEVQVSELRHPLPDEVIG